MANEVSLGVAKAIIDNYFGLLSSSATTVADFYSNDANLSWTGILYKGKIEIFKFLKTVPKFSYQIASVDSQVLLFNDKISMLTISGYMNIPGSPTHHFISTFYIKAIHNGHSAVILSQDFNFI